MRSLTPASSWSPTTPNWQDGCNAVCTWWMAYCRKECIHRVVNDKQKPLSPCWRGVKTSVHPADSNAPNKKASPEHLESCGYNRQPNRTKKNESDEGSENKNRFTGQARTGMAE